ncbi:TPA: 4-hydroxybutyryl-CoA dehydratase, partial [Candidatus Micrarchaeota archaeon]|nr:4-hydroxybutyryl-CoA dehydratase [Candidatus Micrarchaeota archaeon]
GMDLDVPSPYGHRQTSIVVFDEVFVPKERVFLCGEVAFAGRLVEYFAAHHRGGGAGCKAGFADVIIGASALMADANGVLGAQPVRQKLVEMKYHSEAAYAAGVAAAVKGRRHPSGAYIPDPMMANVAKLEAVTHLKELITMAADLGGGVVVGAPSARDLRVPGLGERLRAVLQASRAYSPEDRLRAARLLEVWTAGTHLVGLVQGGGPPATQLLSIARLLERELPALLENAKALAGVRGGW